MPPWRLKPPKIDSLRGRSCEGTGRVSLRERGADPQRGLRRHGTDPQRGRRRDGNGSQHERSRRHKSASSRTDSLRGRSIGIVVDDDEGTSPRSLSPRAYPSGRARVRPPRTLRSCSASTWRLIRECLRFSTKDAIARATLPRGPGTRRRCMSRREAQWGTSNPR